METNEGRLYNYHEYLIRLDKELSEKLVQFSEDNDMTLTGTVRRSLRQFFDKQGTSEPSTVKNNDHMNENRDK